MSPTTEGRLAEYFRRLAQAAPEQTAVGAKALLARPMIEVENEMIEIPNDPSQWATDGRMYPILDDNWEELKGGAWLGRSRGHRTDVGGNGAIEIRRKSDEKVELARP